MTGWAIASVLALALLYAARRAGRAEADLEQLRRALRAAEARAEAIGHVATMDDAGVRAALADRVRAARGDLSAGQSGDGDD